jgi:signal transduction histidine kinase
MERPYANIHELILDIRRELWHLKGMDMIEFIMQWQQECEPSIHLSELKSILKELITNAVHFHKRSGDDSYVLIDAQIAKDQITFRIEDNGRGMSTEHLQKLRQLLEQEHLLPTSGLLRIKQSLYRWKGHISVTSSFGAGCTFTVEIPQ